MDSLITTIPVYNGEKYIAETLDSLARQSRRPDRVIVIDNCSTDRTCQIVENFQAIPCELRRNEKNVGLFGNLNRCLELASQTEYLHMLHADDLLKPDFYQRILAELNAVSGRALAFCQNDMINEKGERASTPPRTTVGSRIIPARDFIIARVELRPIYAPCVLLKTAREPAPCQFRLDLPQLGDQLFWAEWASHCDNVVELSDNLCQYRVYSGNTTQTNKSSLQSWVLDEWRTMQFASQLLGETGLPRWVQQQKLKCIFAARSVVKINLTKSSAPEFAKAVKPAARTIVSPLHWMLGTLAVRLRDTIKPQPK